MNPRNACAVAAGGLPLIWPALVNGYPLLFSDTGAFLEQLLRPFMIWDKPWIYGPAVVVVSLKLTLWLPVLAQSVLVSWTLWRVQAAFRPPSPGLHLGLCLMLASGTTAAWFTSLLMPDILAPLTVLTLFLLAFDPDRRARWRLTALASFAIAAHFAHLVIAAACLGVVLGLRPSAFMRTATPFVAAVALLMATNLVGNGRPGLSPYGAVFALARLVADGPAKRQLEATCPDAGYWLCTRVGRLPADADAFLWNPTGPVWSFPGGPEALAHEASRIVTATTLDQPRAVARGAAGNTAAQLGLVGLDRAFSGDWLDIRVGAQLRAHYPEAEVKRFDASRQRADGLLGFAAFWARAHIVVLVLGLAGSAVLLTRSWRKDRIMFALIVLIAVGELSNAFATGALSGPHDRYQARIAWLVLLPPSMWAMQRRRGPGHDIKGESRR